MPWLDDAFGLSIRLNHRIYDCIDLAIAIGGDGRGLTADKGLVKAAKRHGLGRYVDGLVDL